MINRYCEICNTSFRYYPSENGHHGNNRRFCSRVCYYKARKFGLIRFGTGWHHSDKFKLNRSKMYSGRGNPNYGKHITEYTRQLIRDSKIALWKTKEYRDMAIPKMMEWRRRRPTSLEKEMIGILKRNNLPYKYTGDGSFLIGYKNPDFVNVNGEKKCIEVSNFYHHQNNYMEKRKAHFARWGWKCIVFMVDTNKHLNEKEVLNQVEVL